ncbi:MAG: hypothetical protein D6690_01565 [Nitrospirae bacterium]|nr:MAG: hypothetical protein D6690_01565 [Nitrospirota bacterium]
MVRWKSIGQSSPRDSMHARVVIRLRPTHTIGLCLFLASLVILGPAVWSQAQQINNDYFSPSRDEKLLRMVERYHLTPKTFWPKYREGVVSGKFRLAVKELEFVLRYFPNHPKALMLLANIAKMTKTRHLADAYFKKALHLYPRYALTHAQYGKFLSDMGSVAEGIEHLQQAITLDPRLAVAYDWLAKAYRVQGKYQEASAIEQQKMRMVEGASP